MMSKIEIDNANVRFAGKLWASQLHDSMIVKIIVSMFGLKIIVIKKRKQKLSRLGCVQLKCCVDGGQNYKHELISQLVGRTFNSLC
mgnify:CR=1 FL=1